jgi:Fe-S-cluster containining protein
MDQKVHPGSAHVWLKKTVKAFLDYRYDRPAAIDVPCGSCHACCYGYETEVRDSDDPSLERVPGVKYAYSLPQEADGRCKYFMDEQCQVYDKRPACCRIYDCRQMFFARTRGKRTDINAAIERWSDTQVVKTLEDKAALLLFRVVREDAVRMANGLREGEDGTNCEDIAMMTVILAGMKLGMISESDRPQA